MRRARWITSAVVCLLALAVSATATAAVPPNPKDPCVKGTRNTCGTTGVGFYGTNRYGTRWLGDFRGAIPNTSHTFCIDLRFWYPSPAYDYVEDTSATLRNKDGEAVPLPNRQKIAYAIWEYGRSTNANQQAAVALYVHSLMGDARPGEVDPDQFGAAVSAVYDRVKHDADRYHGPYRVEVRLPAGVRVGRQATATVRVLAVGGAALPGQTLKIAAVGATGVTGQVETGDSGVARVTFTASGGPLKLTATAAGLASSLPRVFRPTSSAAAANGQRLVLSASQTVTGDSSTTVSKQQLTVSTATVPTEVLSGGESRDRVAIGQADGWKGTVQVHLYGPFRTTDAIACTGAPLLRTSFSASGNGVTTTPALRPPKPGWYVYQEIVPGDAGHVGLTTPCNAPSERVRAVVQPTVVTTVSTQSTTPGTEISDTVVVSGLQGETATVQASLYGPFSKQSAIVCTGTPVWTGTIPVTADGTYQTEPFTPTVPGYYTYRESVVPAGFVKAVQTPCAEAAETTVVKGAPKIVTQVSSQLIKPGSTITDKVVVTGLGALEATVKAELYGPFETRAAVKCSATPAWQGTFTATGDGTYTTTKLRVQKVGYYTYRESIAAGAAFDAFTSACGTVSETTLATAAPAITTVVSSELVRPGATIADHVKVTGLGRTPATVEVALYGPFSTREAVGCTGAVVWKGRLQVTGDGTFTSPAVRAAKAGFYVFHETLVGSTLVKSTQTGCSDVPETSLATPLVITGRGDRTREVRVRASSPLAPTHVTLSSVAIDAPVSAVGIDTQKGVLGVAPNIHRTGWWKDGALPGSKHGAILIAGHVDSAKGGAGAFFHLKDATPGDRVEVTTAGGRKFHYRVTSIHTYLKAELPVDVYSLRGAPRLVLVTCGGPFNHSTGHYRDNIVLTAVPV